MLREATVTAIRPSKLSKAYGLGRGLFELDLEVAQQEAFGCLGPNGAWQDNDDPIAHRHHRQVGAAAHPAEICDDLLAAPGGGIPTQSSQPQ